VTHYLIVHKNPEDGLEIQHPDDCPTQPGRHGGDYVEHACMIGQIEAFVGLGWRHTDVPDSFGRTEPLRPGRYHLDYFTDGDGAHLYLPDAAG
jgi:hypothetical protein